MTKDNIKELLNLLEFEHDGNIYTKTYENVNEPLKIDISGDGHIFYRECVYAEFIRELYASSFTDSIYFFR